MKPNQKFFNTGEKSTTLEKDYKIMNSQSAWGNLSERTNPKSVLEKMLRQNSLSNPRQSIPLNTRISKRLLFDFKRSNSLSPDENSLNLSRPASNSLLDNVS